ncbi:MAG: N-acetyl-gamma-glutamyl-phosphate reductase [Elusimicrobia bacterium]|nr:N-acetyl-gamma-glutamyl-phosphate reductase [Elusimicrobiota bacterium]
MTAKVGIVSGAGYTGGELLRLLLAHPGVEVAAVSSTTFPGQPLHKAHPQLRGLTALTFSPSLDPRGLDAVFLAGGHGEAMTRVPELTGQAPGVKVVDLSADFRLKDAKLYPLHYGRVHVAPDLLKDFVYGLPELDRAAVASASRVANPGCFATAMTLALAPLAKAGIKGTAAVTAVTGSSGSGASPGSGTHHPTREGNLRAYKPLAHQHVPEVEQALDALAGQESLRLALVPVSGPFVRGIYAVCHVELPANWSEARVKALYEEAYGACRFVRLLDAPPEVKAVAGSNHCDVHVATLGRRGVVIAALDNLVKGAAGQAVQNLNLMLGLDEAAGLNAAGAYP